MIKMSEKKKVSGGRIAALIIIIIVVAALISPSLLGFLPESVQQTLAKFSESYLGAFQPLKDSNGKFDYLRIVALAVAIAACWAVNAVLQFVLRAFKAKTRKGNTVKSLFASLIKYVIAIYAIIYGLSILGFNVGAVIASLGVLGLVIGFGAQSLIEDVITGLFIVMEGQLQVGDIVAIDNLCEELGDVLLQILLYSDMAEADGYFSLEDVITGIARKMVRRHPNVFGDAVTETPEEAFALWKEIKALEKAGKIK